MAGAWAGRRQRRGGDARGRCRLLPPPARPPAPLPGSARGDVSARRRGGGPGSGAGTAAAAALSPHRPPSSPTVPSSSPAPSSSPSPSGLGCPQGGGCLRSSGEITMWPPGWRRRAPAPLTRSGRVTAARAGVGAPWGGRASLGAKGGRASTPKFYICDSIGIGKKKRFWVKIGRARCFRPLQRLPRLFIG